MSKNNFKPAPDKKKKSRERSKREAAKGAAVVNSPQNHQQRFESLLDDAVLGVKKK
jgi:hypothetical protein